MPLVAMPHRSKGGYKYFIFNELHDGESREVAHITDTKTWKGIGVKAAPPISHEGGAASNAAPGGVLLRQVAEDGPQSGSLVKLSALRCFKGLTVPRPASLYDVLGVSRVEGKPRLEKDLCRALLEHVLPQLGGDEREEVMGRRFNATANCSVLDQRSVLASAGNQEAVQGFTDDDEVERELNNFVEQKLGIKLKGKPKTASLPERSAASGPSSSSSGTKLPEAATISLQDAKKFMPAGCLMNDLATHMRWQITHKEKESAPFSHTALFLERMRLPTHRGLHCWNA